MTDDGPAVLVTGVTGMAGVDLVAEMLTVEEAPMRLLIRDGDQPARSRFDDLLAGLRRRGVDRRSLDRVGLVVADLAEDRFGLDDPAYRRLGATTTAVLHAAADTRFSQSLENARSANVETTRRIASFAADCSSLERVGYISTAYVAGTRSGTIMESDLEPTEFVNAYEQSKFEAEELLRTAMGDLPIAVYRWSTVFGSSATGAVTKPTAVHRAIELAYAGLVPMVPGELGSRIDLVDVEFVTRAVAWLFGEGFEPGETYHLIAGAERSFTLEEFINTTYRVLGELDPVWLDRGIEPPPIVDAAVFEILATMVSTVDDPEAAAVLAALASFVPQLLHPKEFDTTGRDAVLPATIAPTPIDDYFASVIEYSLDTGWWRRIPEEAA